MVAIVDCNSFYCSCERIFRPDLWEHPVVVLSNNDGCIVSRTDEAKALGIKMGEPYFQAKELLEKHNVAVFSSNYALYGDMSRRVMDTIGVIVGMENVEIYSVDECFIDVSKIALSQLKDVAESIRDTVVKWTGIPVSVGIAPTKVLSKVANRLAKKHKVVTQGVLILDTPRKVEQALHKTNVEDIWGVGRKYAEKLNKMNIKTAYELSQQDLQWAVNHLGGVVGERLVRELKGEPCIDFQPPLSVKKMIATSRMFGKPVSDIASIKEAVATYTARAAEKLRRQQCVAQTIHVYLIPKVEHVQGQKFRHGASQGCYVKLPVATALTNELTKAARQLVDSIYKSGQLYTKAGVTLSDIIPDTAIQGNLFNAPTTNKAAGNRLMQVMDNINFSMRKDMLKLASIGTTQHWSMKCKFQSPRFSTRWNELIKVQ